MQDIAKTIKQLHARQLMVRKVAPTTKGHRTILVSLQTTHAALGAAAAILADLQPLLQPRGSKKPTRQELEDLWGAELRGTLEDLIDTVELLASGKDKEVIRKAGLKFLVTFAKWLVKASPIRPDDVKDGLELFSAITDIAGLRKALKERTQQAKAAASLLRWSQVVTLIAMHWSMEAQRLLNLLTHQPDETDEQLLASVQRRMVATVPSWDAPAK